MTTHKKNGSLIHQTNLKQCCLCLVFKIQKNFFLSNYGAQSAGIESSLIDSIKNIQVISNIGDQVSPTPETAICAGQVADNIKGYVFQTKEILTNSYGTLDLQ